MHEEIGLSSVNEMLYIKQLRPRLKVQTEMVCLLTSFSDLKMIHVFTGKIK